MGNEIKQILIYLIEVLTLLAFGLTALILNCDLTITASLYFITFAIASYYFIKK